MKKEKCLDHKVERLMKSQKIRRRNREVFLSNCCKLCEKRFFFTNISLYEKHFCRPRKLFTDYCIKSKISKKFQVWKSMMMRI